jgi:hypothetical protein
MTDFKPTMEQQELIAAAQLRFEKSREATKHYSKRFVDKCNDQSMAADSEKQRTSTPTPEH